MANHNLDADQTLKEAYDAVTGRYKVDATVTASIGEVVVKDAITGDTQKVNADGSIDANVVVSAAGGDSIRISDGVDELVVNSDGSINARDSLALFTLPYDAITAEYPSVTQEVYKSRVGGITGTVQQTVTVNYTDSSKEFILNAARV